jgi:hypothetical protein
MTTLAEPIYCTVAELVAELEAQEASGIPDTTRAIRQIEDAEDLIDRLLGGWYWGPNEETGRKVTQGDVMSYQWAKLTRATVKLAARLYQQPKLLDQVYQAVRGPDFSFTGPKGGALVTIIGVQVLALLDDSGLRRVAGHARPGRGRGIRAGYERFLTATRHDGT